MYKGFANYFICAFEILICSVNELQDALNMTYQDFPTRYNRDKVGPHTLIIFVCRSGRRSAEAVRLALAMGYSK